ncbi:MAG TPA: alpha/beta hydrolase-fold protein [Candidatus Cybelea sp.]|nr:alpha/beta hydrolase-fold protein [Candidatus Cybelea sp.]
MSPPGISREWVGLAALFLLILMTFVRGTLSQQPSGEPIVSPEVSYDHRVTFRFGAPYAKAVSVRMEGYGQPLGMTKDAGGVWNVTTDPLAPDYYGYSILMDGVALIDPANHVIKPNLLGPASEVYVAGSATLPWELNDVSHGVIHHHFYHSRIVGDDRDFYVYTPPGYDPSSPATYPVLYLLHGFSDDASAWTAVGRANVILDNLIAQRKAKPMLIVMPLGYGAPEILEGGWAGIRRNDQRLHDLFRKNQEQFGEALLDEVIPMVEHSYRVKADRDSRALAGLSMGGSETLFVGLNNLDRFSYLGAFSAGGGRTDYAATYPRLDSRANARLRVFWMSVGKSDGLLVPNEKFHDWLGGKGIRVEWVESPGGHWWPVWRRNLSDLLPQLFQQQRAALSDFWSQKAQEQR